MIKKSRDSEIKVVETQVLQTDSYGVSMEMNQVLSMRETVVKLGLWHLAVEPGFISVAFSLLASIPYGEMPC